MRLHQQAMRHQPQTRQLHQRARTRLPQHARRRAPSRPRSSPLASLPLLLLMLPRVRPQRPLRRHATLAHAAAKEDAIRPSASSAATPFRRPSPPCHEARPPRVSLHDPLTTTSATLYSTSLAHSILLAHAAAGSAAFTSSPDTPMHD
jgi:hypothetical protein